MIVAPIVVIAALVPGVGMGVMLGRAGRHGVVALGIVLCEILVLVLTGWPVFGLAAYVWLVGRATFRVDPRLRGLKGLHPWGDMEIPLAAPGIFAGAALAFGANIAAGLSGGWAAALGIGVGLVALALDQQHAETLLSTGSARGCRGPLGFPHLSVRDQLELVKVSVPEALMPVADRRPRSLDPQQREALGEALMGAERL